jgi:transcriptional antiterminator RfaH
MSWFAVQTMPRAEDKARSHLVRQNYETYLPRLRKKRRHARRVETVLRPLFPGYLFVRFDPERDAWRAINSTVGVTRLVGFGDAPVPVSDRVIEGLRSLEDENGIIVGAGPQLKPGQSVRILDGALADQIGVLLEGSGMERVRLLVRLLGREVKVVMPGDLVEQAETP